MEKPKKSGLKNLANKTTAIIAGALATLTGMQVNKAIAQNNNSEDLNKQEFKAGKPKPMTVLKLNINNPQSSLLVAQHGSHSSHSSHASHSSHSSHSSSSVSYN